MEKNYKAQGGQAPKKEKSQSPRKNSQYQITNSNKK